MCFRCLPFRMIHSFVIVVAGRRQAPATYSATIACVLDNDNDKSRRWRVHNNDKPDKSPMRCRMTSLMLDARRAVRVKSEGYDSQFVSCLVYIIELHILTDIKVLKWIFKRGKFIMNYCYGNVDH